jgi:hypothetical protein
MVEKSALAATERLGTRVSRFRKQSGVPDLALVIDDEA